MAADKNHKILVKKLKKQIRVSRRKETQSRNKLRAALKKIYKLGKSYENKLSSKIRIMKSKVAEAQAATYAKVAIEIERQLRKSLVAKAKSLNSAVGKLENKYISKLTKSIAKKGKKK